MWYSRRFADAKSSWDAQCAIIPRLLNAVQEARPNCELYTRCPARTDIARSLGSLQHSSPLVALELMLERSQLQALTELRKLLVTCPNLRKLSLTCSSRLVGAEPLALCVPGWQLPPLNFLKLRGMMVAATTEVKWQECMDWEALEVLQCTDINSFTGISTSLQRLQSLEVHLDEAFPPQIQQIHAFFDFVKSSSTLQNLCMAGMIEHMRAHKFLEGRHPSLRIIRVHEKVSRWGFSESSVLSPEEIRMLAKACPGLQKCSIGIGMWSEWVSNLSFMTSPMEACAKNSTF